MFDVTRKKFENPMNFLDFKTFLTKKYDIFRIRQSIDLSLMKCEPEKNICDSNYLLAMKEGTENGFPIEIGEQTYKGKFLMSLCFC